MSPISTQYSNQNKKPQIMENTLKSSSISSNTITNRVLAVVSYFTLVGWFIALMMNEKEQCTLVKFHLRQSLGLIITGAVLMLIPLIGWCLNVVLLAAWFVGVISALKQQEYLIPFLGEFYQRHLVFIK